MLNTITPPKPFTRSRLLAISLAIAILCTGCAATKTFVPVTAPSGTNALVYFIRKKYPPYIHEARLVVNNAKLATIANDDFVAVNVPIGTNEILVDVTDGKPFRFNLPVKRAERMYVILTGDVTYAGSEYTGNHHTIRLNWGLRAINVNKTEAQTIVATFGKSFE